MENKVAIHFFIKRSNVNSKGSVPIYMRITLNGKRLEISTNRFINPKDWKTGNGIAKDKVEENAILNSHLSSLKTKVYKALNTMELGGTEQTAEALKAVMHGKKQRKHSLIETIKYHNARMKSLIGKDFAIGTYKRYEITLGKVKAFLLFQFNKSDIGLSELNYAFITNFEFFLKTHDNLQNNTAMKYIKNFKRIVHFAMQNAWMDIDHLFNSIVHI